MGSWYNKESLEEKDFGIVERVDNDMLEGETLPFDEEWLGNCSEDWECEEWSNCKNGLQRRSCSDSNSCGTKNNKPTLLQSCEALIVNTLGNCVDSDNGKNKYTKGTVTGVWDFQGKDSTDVSSHTDGCRYNYGEVNGFPAAVGEYYCNDEGRKSEVTLSCENGCEDGACLKSPRECKTSRNGICTEYYLEDYKSCNNDRECTEPCENCAEGTLNCIDLGRRSIYGSDSYNYSDYKHYFMCGECIIDQDCRDGYECAFENMCIPNFKTTCDRESCENCISGNKKYFKQGTFQKCYECETGEDCRSGICANGGCQP